jgi:hypothetical protein
MVLEICRWSHIVANHISVHIHVLRPSRQKSPSSDGSGHKLLPSVFLRAEESLHPSFPRLKEVSMYWLEI